MTIRPIVEGHGEVRAVPQLLRRLCTEAEAYEIQIGKPIRQKRPQLLREDSLRRAVRLAMLQPDCSAILILFDSDDDCPKELAPTLEGWAKAEAGAVPCAVVMAHREYEAWFLASIESLRGKRGIAADAEPHARPETPRDAKGQLGRRMAPGQNYSPAIDQTALTAQFDMAVAHQRCRSFRRMAKAFGALAIGVGVSLDKWPPASWTHGGQGP